MKIFNLKLFSIFILLLFCLAPLGAIDINQDNNTDSIIPDNNSSEIVVDDVDTVDDDNQTEDNNDSQISENESPIVNESVNDLNETNDNTSSNGYPYISIHVDDIKEGETALVEVHTCENISAAVYVTVDHVRRLLWLDHGYASLEISGLEPGTYEAVVDTHDTKQRNSTTFKVNPKADPKLIVNVDDIDSGDRASADIYFDEGYTGDVDVILDGFVAKVYHHVNGGHVHVDFKTELDPGQHKVEVITTETPDYKRNDKTVDFTVSRDLHMNIEVTNNTEGQNPVVTIKTHSKYNGLILVTAPYNMEFGCAEDGVFTCQLEGDKLTKGTHDMQILAWGDGPFNQYFEELTFDII